MRTPTLGWYVPRDNSHPRWLLGVMPDVEGRARVRYGTGGETHRDCLVETFKRWRLRSGATLQREAVDVGAAMDARVIA